MSSRGWGAGAFLTALILLADPAWAQHNAQGTEAGTAESVLSLSERALRSVSAVTLPKSITRVYGEDDQSRAWQRAFDSLFSRNGESLSEVVQSGTDVPHVDLLQAFDARNSSGDLPPIVLSTMTDESWERRVIANILATHHHMYKRDNIAALRAINEALNSVPYDDQSPVAESARFESWVYTLALTVMERDVEGAVGAAEELAAIEARTGWRRDHVTRLYNLGLVFDAVGDRDTARTLLEAASRLPDAKEPVAAQLLAYGLGKLLTRMGEGAAAIPHLRVAEADATSDIGKSSASLRLALAHAQTGDASAARDALARFDTVNLDAEVLQRAARLRHQVEAEIAIVETRLADAVEHQRAYIALQERDQTERLSADRRTARAALQATDAVLDEQAKRHESELSAATTRNRLLTRTAIAMAILVSVLLVLTNVWLRASRRNARLALEKSTLAERLAVQADELDMQRIAAQAADRAKTEFLGVMGHQQNTPLNAMLPILELLHDGERDPVRRTQFHMCLQGAREIASNFRNLGLLTSAQQGGLIPDADIVAVGDVLKRRFDEHSSGQEGSCVKLRFNDLTDALELRTDVTKLTVIFDALLDNAVRFTAEGSVAVNLSRTEEGGLNLFIQDSGCGMDPDFAARATEPFLQEDMSFTRKHDGWGIGLAVVEALVTCLDGRVRIATQVGQGTAVQVTIPNLSYSQCVPIPLPSDTARPFPNRPGREADGTPGARHPERVA